MMIEFSQSDIEDFVSPVDEHERFRRVFEELAYTNDPELRQSVCDCGAWLGHQRLAPAALQQFQSLYAGTGMSYPEVGNLKPEGRVIIGVSYLKVLDILGKTGLTEFEKRIMQSHQKLRGRLSSSDPDCLSHILVRAQERAANDRNYHAKLVGGMITLNNIIQATSRGRTGKPEIVGSDCTTHDLPDFTDWFEGGEVPPHFCREYAPPAPTRIAPSPPLA